MGIFSWKSPETPNNLRETPDPTGQRGPLVASAQRIDSRNSIQMERFAETRKRTQWQSEAWDFYDMIAELKFSANLIANVLSRINLYVAYVDDTGRVPAHIRKSEAAKHAPVAEGILALLETSDGGTSNILRLAALNMFVTGEFYLVKVPGDSFHDPKTYEIRSVDEVVVEGTGKSQRIYLKDAPNQDRRFWKEVTNGYICRMWRKHPRYADEADSSVRGVLDDCDDLVLYSREARSTSLSRIPAGILYLPDSIVNASRPNTSGHEDEEDDYEGEQYDIAQEITNALVAPVEDESSPHNIAPFVVTGPIDAGKDIRYISLERSYDQMYQQNVEHKIERILTGLDIPKDVAKGLSSVKYSNGTLIEESLYKSHIEPLILMIVDAFTKGFLYPAMVANGIPEHIAKKIVVWYDPSAITAKPSKSESANYGVEHHMISHSAWRAANGFGEDSAPDETQLAREMLMNKLMLDPELANTLLQLVFPKLMDGSREESLDAMDSDSANQLEQALGGAGDGSTPAIPADPMAQPESSPTDLVEPDQTYSPQ